MIHCRTTTDRGVAVVPAILFTRATTSAGSGSPSATGILDDETAIPSRAGAHAGGPILGRLGQPGMHR